MNPAEIVLFLSLGFLAGAWAVCIFLMFWRQPALSEDIQAVGDSFDRLEVAHDAAQQGRVLDADDDSMVGLLAIVAERDRELALSLAAALGARGSDLAAVIKRELSVGVFAGGDQKPRVIWDPSRANYSPGYEAADVVPEAKR